MKTRRDFFKITLGSLLLADAVSMFGMKPRSRAPWKIGICDWDLHTTGYNSFAVARELGFEGVQVSYQPEGQDSLADKANQTKFLEAAKKSGVSIASFCIGLMNSQPLATTPEAEDWVKDCINAMVEMNVEQVLVPFFGNADLTQHKEQIPLVVEKFKRLAPIAEKNNKILAVESYLTAEEVLKLIDVVGSNALKVYYDVRNSSDKGYDIFYEIELLGKNKLISQIHFKENHSRLGEGSINFTKVCETLEKIDYDDWVIVESATSGDWKESHIANVQFIRKLIGNQ